MALQIRRYAADGAHTDTPVDGSITIGRATDNTLQLSGLLVGLHHARLDPASTYGLRLQALTQAGVDINGAAGQREAELMVGDELSIGGHRLRLALADDGQSLMLEVREREGREEAGTVAEIASLEAAGWRLRRPAVIGLLLVLGFTLMMPLLLRWWSPPETVRAWLPSDQLWSSGRVSDAHQHFAQQCEVCHETPFVQVRDESCLTCHQTIAQHVHEPDVIAEAGLDQMRCASCHFEHGGTHAVVTRSPTLCVDCHADLPSHGGAEQGVTDFESAHPEFRMTVTRFSEGQATTVREPWSPQLQDQSGLIFPHDLHLAADGVRGPDGLEPLKCASCHVPDVGAVGFQRQDFGRDCQRCHQLDVDIGGLPFRLPHGDTEAVRTLLESAVGLPDMAPDPVSPRSSRRRAGFEADRNTEGELFDEVDEVFERRVCAKCHEVERPEGQPVQIRAPLLRKSWMPSARFTHEAHQWVDCAQCHAAEGSDNSDQLLLPSISSCRACHAGVGSRSGIQSTCITCHQFHQAGDVLMRKWTGKLAREDQREVGG